MTDDEAFLVIAEKAGAITADDIRDFCAQSPLVQQRAARVYQAAIFEQGGPGAWAEFLSTFASVAAIASQASGLSGAYKALANL